MLAIKIFPLPLCFPFPCSPSHIEAEQTGGLLIAAPRLVVSRVNYVGIWRSLVQTKSKCKSFIFAAFHVVHWQLNGCPLPPSLLKHPSLPRCCLYSPGVTKTFTSSWRLPLFVAVVVVVVADCGKTSYTSSVARLATGPAVVASSSRQIKIQIVTKLLVLWRSLIIVKRCGFACNCKCKSCLNCITIGDGFAMIQLWIDYTTKDWGNELDWVTGELIKMR